MGQADLPEGTGRGGGGGAEEDFQKFAFRKRTFVPRVLHLHSILGQAGSRLPWGFHSTWHQDHGPGHFGWKRTLNTLGLMVLCDVCGNSCPRSKG